MSVTKVDDNKYRIFISDGTNLDGSRRRYTKTITTDLKGRDLERFLTLAEYEFEDEIKEKSISYNDMANKSFSNFVVWWMEYVDLTEQTLESYKYNLRYMEDYIGHKKLGDIKQSDMLELLSIVKEKKHNITGEPISPRTVRNHMNIMKSVFKTAVELSIISKNPMNNIRYSVSDYQVEDNYYDIEDINKMIVLLEDEPIVYQFAILLTLSTGLRLGELIALHESDFNRKNHSVTISKSVSETVGTRELSTTKTKKTRVEFYPKELEILLDKQLETDRIKKESLGVENDLIFTGMNGDLIPRKTISDWFRRFLISNDLKRITFHGLRHTSATMLLAAGIPLKNVAERLGHSRASTTANIYAHAIPRFDKDASDVFSNILTTGTKSGTKENKLKVIK